MTINFMTDVGGGRRGILLGGGSDSSHWACCKDERCGVSSPSVNEEMRSGPVDKGSLMRKGREKSRA